MKTGVCMGQKVFVATVALGALIGTGTLADQVSVDRIGAVWANPASSAVDRGTVAVLNGGGSPVVGGETVTISWGVGASGGRQGGYAFNPVSAPFAATPNTPQLLGEFTHFNNPVLSSGGFLETVELALDFAGTPLGVELPTAVTSFGAIFKFAHDEAPRHGGISGCGSKITNNECADVIGVVRVSETTVVDLPSQNGREYTYALLGFSKGGGTTFGTQFVTAGGNGDTAGFYSDYSVSTVPLPAAGWLLFASLSIFAAVGRRRRMSD